MAENDDDLSLNGFDTDGDSLSFDDMDLDWECLRCQKLVRR